MSRLMFLPVSVNNYYIVVVKISSSNSKIPDMFILNTENHKLNKYVPGMRKLVKGTTKLPNPKAPFATSLIRLDLSSTEENPALDHKKMTPAPSAQPAR